MKKKANTITVSGQICDFEGQPIDNCNVILYHADFKIAYETLSDENGYYNLKGVEKGCYFAMFALRMTDYPKANIVPTEDMRLEFWAWNVIADRDLIINPRYHRLELYGTSAFRTNQGLMIYTRPMSLGNLLDFSKNLINDESLTDNITNISVKPEHFDVRVFCDEIPLKIHSTQPIEEFTGNGTATITGYIIQTDFPSQKKDKPYVIIRVEAENTEHNEKGGNLFFFENKDYK